MTVSTTNAPEATRQRNVAQARYDAAQAHHENVRKWVTAGSGSFSHQDLLAAESDMKTKKAILATATAAHATANKAIEGTDDNLADYLMELFEDNRYEFGLTDSDYDKRKRPGKSIPTSLPQIAFCQQASSTRSKGRITGECFVVVYGTEAMMPTLDPRTINSASDRLGGSLQIDNAAQPESLGQNEDGAEVYRKQYRVVAKNVSPKVPVIPEQPTEQDASSIANTIARELRGIHTTSMAQGAVSITRVKILTSVDPSSAKVEVEGQERRAEFTVMVGTAGIYSDFGYDQVLARASTLIHNYYVGTTVGNLGRIKSTGVIHATPINRSSARITIQVIGEAKPA